MLRLTDILLRRVKVILFRRVPVKGFTNFEEIFGDFESIICPEIQIDQIFRFWSMKKL